MIMCAIMFKTKFQDISRTEGIWIEQGRGERRGWTRGRDGE